MNESLFARRSPPPLSEKLRAIEHRYYANVHMPSRFSVFASTGVGIGSYLYGAYAVGFGALSRLERRFIRHACRDSLRMRAAEASVEFSVWPDGDGLYRLVQIKNGLVVSDQRTEPSWSPR